MSDSLSTDSDAPARDWWITTGWLNKKGTRKVMGPFVSMDLAIEVRSYRERLEGHFTYFVDSEPRVTAPDKTLDQSTVHEPQ